MFRMILEGNVVKDWVTHHPLVFIKNYPFTNVYSYAMLWTCLEHEYEFYFTLLFIWGFLWHYSKQKMILNTYYHDFTSKFWIDTTSFWIIIDWALLARQILLCDYWLYLTGSNLRKWSRQLYLQYLKSCDTDSSCSVIMNSCQLYCKVRFCLSSSHFTSVFDRE